MGFVALTLWLALGLAAADFPPLKLTVNVKTNRIEDSDGRERVFHGTNVVFKGPPYYPPTETFDPFLSLAAQDLELLASMGYNSIRLGVLWAGAEPVDGQFNASYFEAVNTIVETAARTYGIYSLLDMHQDDFNEKARDLSCLFVCAIWLTVIVLRRGSANVGRGGHVRELPAAARAPAVPCRSRHKLAEPEHLRHTPVGRVSVLLCIERGHRESLHEPVSDFLVCVCLCLYLYLCLCLRGVCKCVVVVRVQSD
jgi:hypothetical protein